MLLDHDIVPEAIAKPGSFVGLMSIYESNYLRLLQLVPELDRLDGHYQSRVASDLSVHLEILERSRYTVTLSLTYFFFDGEERVADPDMKIRAYLDGSLAEVISFASEDQTRHAALRQLWCRHRHELDVRWRRNVVFNKWLEYLLDRGHLILER